MEYLRLYDDGYGFVSRRELVLQRRARPLLSARLSTGIFGRLDCQAGMRGPKGRSEVIIAASASRLVSKGFLPCPVCKPYEDEGLWGDALWAARRRYDVGTLEEFLDRDRIPFDARRLPIEEIFPLTGVPDRFYIPAGVSQEEVEQLVRRFMSIPLAPPAVGLHPPRIGCYDVGAPGRFRELLAKP